MTEIDREVTWRVQGVFPCGENSNGLTYSYTIDAYDKGLPDLIIMGPNQTGCIIINSLLRTKPLEYFKDGVVESDIYEVVGADGEREPVRMLIRRVNRQLDGDVGNYRMKDRNCLDAKLFQICLADRNNLLPGEEGFIPFGPGSDLLLDNSGVVENGH